MSMTTDTQLKCPPIPTVDPTVNNIIYDEGTSAPSSTPPGSTSKGERRIMVSCFINQVATLFHDVYLLQADGTYSTTARAGNGAGDAISASTILHKDYKLLPGRNVIRIATTTLPTVWEVGARVVTDRALGT
jgi:hypothetical protein